MRIISVTKQKPIVSTNTNPTNWIYILEAEGLHEEVEWIAETIQDALDQRRVE